MTSNGRTTNVPSGEEDAPTDAAATEVRPEEQPKTPAEERAERRAVERAENEGFAPADREVRAAIARRRAELGTT